MIHTKMYARLRELTLNVLDTVEAEFDYSPKVIGTLMIAILSGAMIHRYGLDDFKRLTKSIVEHYERE